LINVLWSTRESATLHILVVHAQIILLTYGSAHSNSELFNNLLLMWFPPGKLLFKDPPFISRLKIGNLTS
jgi:hypothetical protein